MGFFDFFGSSDLEYPTVPSGDGPQRPCGDGPYQPPDADGIFNKLFAPSQLPYPLPSCGTGVAGSVSVGGGAAAALAAVGTFLSSATPFPAAVRAASTSRNIPPIRLSDVRYSSSTSSTAEMPKAAIEA